MANVTGQEFFLVCGLSHKNKRYRKMELKKLMS